MPKIEHILHGNFNRSRLGTGTADKINEIIDAVNDKRDIQFVLQELFHCVRTGEPMSGRLELKIEELIESL